MTERVLVTGGALGDVPIIQFLTESGYQVFTSGDRPNDIGHTFGSRYVAGDYKNEERIEEICIENKINYLIPSAHDIAAITASRVAHKLKFPGFDSPEVSQMIHHKGELRSGLSKSGCKTPIYFQCKSLNTLNEIENLIKFPIIVKPVDLTGGNGISICNSMDSLEKSFVRAFELSIQKNVIIEEFLEGTYHGASCILKNQKVVFSFFDDEHYFYKNFRVSATTFPTTSRTLSQHAIIQEIEKFALNFKLVDGIIHIQFIETANDALIIEICRRTPGDLYPYFINHSLNLNYAQIICEPFLGGSIRINEIKMTTGVNCARYISLPNKRGTYAGIDNQLVDQPEFEFIFRKPGEFIDNPFNWTAAILFFRSKSRMYDIKFLESVKNQFRIVVEDQNVSE